MPSTLLTDRFVRSVKPTSTQTDYFDERVTGLALRVGARSKSWILLYRVGRKLRRWTMGRYPTLSLADARERARQAIKDGGDPALGRVEQREAETFAELAERYVEEYARVRKRSWKDDRRILKTEALPYWRHRPAKEIVRRDVRELVDRVARRGAPTQANRVRALLHKLFNWALSQDVVDLNPVTGVPRPAVEQQRDRVLTDDEIRQLWYALADQSPPMAAFFKLRLITAQRGGEIGNMRWEDLDLAGRWWTIPAADSKNKLPHRVPLTTPATTVLRQLRETRRASELYVLAGARGKRQRSEATQRLRLRDFRGHDLRRTAASRMAPQPASRAWWSGRSSITPKPA